MNELHLIGRLTKDIEVKQTKHGKLMGKFTLAVFDPYTKETDFFYCLIFDEKVNTLNQYVKKGNQLAITGKLKNQRYTNDQGVTSYFTSVIVEKFTLLEYNQMREIKESELPF